VAKRIPAIPVYQAVESDETYWMDIDRIT
jgi:hypothetical protein